jgi:hypothetical protein
MDLYGLILAIVVFLGVVAVSIYAARSRKAKALREAETRRPVDKGKHVEL